MKRTKKMVQAKESLCSKVEECERTLHVGRIVITHYNRSTERSSKR